MNPNRILKRTPFSTDVPRPPPIGTRRKKSGDFRKSFVVFSMLHLARLEYSVYMVGSLYFLSGFADACVGYSCVLVCS